MKLVATYPLFALMLACSPGVKSHPGSPPDSAIPPDAPADSSQETQALGMNDVSIVDPAMFVPIGKMNGLDGARDLISRSLYARLTTAHHDLVYDFDDFFLFSIRFDLCDRAAPGPCPDGADGSLRLVFQPLLGSRGAVDVGLHAFYTIPAADLGHVVNELRAIARLRGTQSELHGPLSGRSIGFPEASLPRIYALLDQYAVSERLIRLSAMGQDVRSTSPRVVFRGLELRNGEMVDITVATLDVSEQVAALTSPGPSYDVTPVADSPAGFALALTSDSFNAATPADQRFALDALVATQNPRLHTSSTVQCIGCHTSTYLGIHRALDAGIDISGLPSAFTTTHDVRLDETISGTNPSSLHNFGWVTFDVAISRRVINETAVVLDEIEQRFPVP